MTLPTKFNRDQLEKKDKPDLIDLVEVLLARVQQLETLVQEQAATIQALQDQLGKNSRNSGKPPSSDGLKKPRTRSLRQKTGRKPGGQKGHQGHTLKMSDKPDHIEPHHLDQCPHCQGDLSSVPSSGYPQDYLFVPGGKCLMCHPCA